ncbi:cupin domain-containing protein [Enterovibrio baiacu]|uniref:cupin domain-containing protein n=1 Tax=Enterovibrio baiacu TaxID=2491023 RepID=UPI003D0E0022
MLGRIKNDESFNLLTDILETLRFRGSIFLSSDLSAPWGISLEQKGYPRFHITMKGKCYVGIKGDQELQADEMELVFLPNGDKHWLADDPSNPRIASESMEEACALHKPLFQNGITTHRLMCGMVKFDDGLSHPVLDALPDILHFKNISHDDPIWTLITLIDHQIRESGYQDNLIVDKLTEVLFITLLRHYLNENDKILDFISNTRDKRILKALSLMHEDPAKEWTLDELGKQIGMSRATLVRHFQDAIGMAPIAYLNHWRRLKAYQALRYTDESVDKIAVSLGFTSGQTLSRAMIREMGISPGELRKQRKT